MRNPAGPNGASVATATRTVCPCSTVASAGTVPSTESDPATQDPVRLSKIEPRALLITSAPVPAIAQADRTRGQHRSGQVVRPLGGGRTACRAESPAADGRRCGGFRRPHTLLDVRNIRRPGEVENGRRGNVGYVLISISFATAGSGQDVGNAVGGSQTEERTAREADSVDFVREVVRTQDFGVADRP